MKEFVNGTAAQFAALDSELNRGNFYKYANRQLPACCTPSVACLWFSKKDQIYRIQIEEGITTTANNADFRAFLEKGEIKFVCLEDMAAFLRSLAPLFSSGASEESRTPSPGVENPVPAPEVNDPEGEVFDSRKLQEIMDRDKKPKTVWPEEIAVPLKKKVYGQDAAIDALADKIVINQMRKDKRLLTIGLFGPTGTGKSETAKSLSEIMSTLYGTNYGFIEIAGSEFIGEHTVHRFFGAPPGYVGHGQPTVLEPVRKNPYHIIVINEVEKADDKFLVGIMEAVDTGKLGMADNSKPIDLNRCILLFTSNIPIDMCEYNVATDFERSEMCRDAFTKHCGRPEISGKIGNFLAFSPLDYDANSKIVVKFIREELKSYDLKLNHVDEHLMADFLGHKTEYGARGIGDLVSESIGRHLLRARKLDEFKGKSIIFKGTIDNIEFEVA